MIIYKVVRKVYSKSFLGFIRRKRLQSAIMTKWLSVNYKIGNFVKAPKKSVKRGYHLTAFKTYENALDFTITFDSTYGHKIYKAEGWNQILPLPTILNAFELADHKKFISNPDWSWPEGTVMFKKIKLLEEVKDILKEQANDMEKPI